MEIEKDAVSAQKLGQLQPSTAALPRNARVSLHLLSGPNALRSLEGVLEPLLFIYISGVLPEKARLDAAGAIKVNLREICTLLSIERT